MAKQFVLPAAEDQATVSVEEAAQVLGISRGSAYAAARNGDLPAIRVGKRLLISTAGLRRMLQLDPVDAA